MEQVFFRLHVRFVTTVTRLLSPKTRRVLEYVTLANAFLLVTSLAWLHTRFVNPKGRQGSTVSCLPAALEKAGVDPAQLHVLQIHIRQPPDDWGDGGGGSGRRKKLMSFPGGGSRIDDSSSSGTNAEQQVQDSRRHSGGAAGSAGLGISGLGGGESGYGSATDTAATACTGSGEEEGAARGSESSSSSSSSSGGGGLLPPRLDSPPSSPEIFYSMKLVTGKDAVGTLSGPGT
ncbi:unnamed protein product, partial [Ectocarpus sp. 4 AP-2014]